MMKLLGMILALVIAGPATTLTPKPPAQAATVIQKSADVPDPWANLIQGRAWISFGDLNADRTMEHTVGFRQAGLRDGAITDWEPEEPVPAEGSMIKLLAKRDLLIHDFGRVGEANVDLSPGAIFKVDLPDYTGGVLLPQSSFSLVKVLKVAFGPKNPAGRSAVWLQVAKVVISAP